MSKSVSVGFPRMMKESGEKRVFLPEFIQFVAEKGATVYVEEGYGSRSGFTFDDFHQTNPAVRRCSRKEAFQKDYVMVLRSPTEGEFKLIRPGSCLISMLHYPTRPRRIQILTELGIDAISLDGIVNDNNIRLVENMKAVAWNGLQAAFDALENRFPGLRRPDGQPIRTLILGSGMVGKHAVEAACKVGNIERNNQYMEEGFPGVITLVAGRNLSSNPEIMERLFRQTDILTDATQRRDPSVPVVPNSWIEWLPEHAVIVDLAVDPYSLETNPPVVRGVEGIPQGNLNQYVFDPDDPNWNRTVPPSVPSKHRRTTATCYSWPGVHPESCMRHYASQLEPLMEALLAKGYHDLSEEGSYFERALYRASLKGWIETHK